MGGPLIETSGKRRCAVATCFLSALSKHDQYYAGLLNEAAASNIVIQLASDSPTLVKSPTAPTLLK